VKKLIQVCVNSNSNNSVCCFVFLGIERTFLLSRLGEHAQMKTLQEKLCNSSLLVFNYSTLMAHQRLILVLEFQSQHIKMMTFKYLPELGPARKKK
jgi:hypothetical protein